MKGLEKTLDLDSFGQVSFKLPQHIGGDTSFAGLLNNHYKRPEQYQLKARR